MTPPVLPGLSLPANLTHSSYHPGFNGVPPSAQPSSYPPPEPQYNPQGSAARYAEAAAAVAAGQKRPAPDDGDEDAFETDTRAPRPRRKASGKPRAKRSRKMKASEGEAGPSSDPVAPMADMDIMLGSHMEPDLDALTQRSREVAAAHRKPKEPQTRIPWSQNDVKFLIRAVDIYRCKWSKIASEIKSGRIPFQHMRNQQALRDKARILKQDYLR